jgi:hypothetical protein
MDMWDLERTGRLGDPCPFHVQKCERERLGLRLLMETRATQESAGVQVPGLESSEDWPGIVGGVGV